ncbi:MAG: SulP family inorganic anion transporter [Chloroflexi bacterium HGW-Chloroflexi-4]|nr:MAG: SulP family inorganic anion transporter [Chloroflexi bacterium HGW-Chloroflexi-4]
MPRRSLKQLYVSEFSGYTLHKLRQDLMAGLTVAAVALPLALAFGVVSGATAAAGLVTAVIAGFLIGALSGAPFQISGPTGAMSAVLIVLAQKYGLNGVWIAGLMSGVFLTIIGLLRLGRFIAFIPSPVITGFTSGIALIIFIGQIDNFLGVKTAAVESSVLKVANYFIGGFIVDWHSIVLAGVVIATMVLWPKKWNLKFPSSLLGIILATGINLLVKWPVNVIGVIPQTLLLSDRLNFTDIPWGNLEQFLGPALTITALGAIESLLCGTVASNMTGTRLQANQELIGQGIGNMIIPFFGGVPATAAIARSSVGIKSGGQTRLVSIFHALGLLLSMFLLAPIMAKIPLAALAGVLMVTAFKMNEWESIRFMFKKRFKTAIAAFTITMFATVALDLTQAILIGSIISVMLFINQIAQIDITIQEIDHDKLLDKGIELKNRCEHVKVAYITGPLFFAAIGSFNEAFANLDGEGTLILSMRGVSLIDTAGVEAIEKLFEKYHRQGGEIMFAGTHDNAFHMLERAGIVEKIGKENFFWSSDQAILEAEQRIA